MSDSRDAKRQAGTLNSDLIVGGVCLALAAVVYFSTRHLSPLGGVFVNYVLVAMVGLSVLIVIKGFIRPDYVRFFESMVERNNVLIGIVMLGLYLFFLPRLGFLPSSYLFYFTFNLYLSENRLATRNLLISAALSLVVVTVFYYVFHYFLEVPLPEGAWFA